MTFRLHDNHARHLGRQPTITADAEPESTGDSRPDECLSGATVEPG